MTELFNQLMSTSDALQSFQETGKKKSKGNRATSNNQLPQTMWIQESDFWDAQTPGFYDDLGEFDFSKKLSKPKSTTKPIFKKTSTQLVANLAVAMSKQKEYARVS